MVGLVLILMALRTAEDDLCGEYLGMLTLVVVGLMLASTAADLVLLFLAMELVSIPTYVLLSLGGRDHPVQEATAKYFFLSILSSVLLLYGFSFLYGVAGTMQLSGMREHFAAARTVSGGGGPAALVGLVVVFVLAGLAFKIAAVPFHFYAPDVYQGTSYVNAGLLATAPKIVGMVALARILVVAVVPGTPLAWQIVLILSLLTMTLGNVCALWQRDIRRLLAYSSIAHGGYMLIGLSVALVRPDVAGTVSLGLGAVFFYLGVYVLAVLGTFAALVYLSPPGAELREVPELAGLGRAHPLIAGAIALFMFSLTGIPPLAGFWGKLGLFVAALDTAVADSPDSPATSGWFLVLAVLGVLNAATAAAYYLRIVGTMYFQDGQRERVPVRNGGAASATLACAVLVLMIGLWPGPLAALTRGAALSARDAGSLRANSLQADSLQANTRQTGYAVTPSVADAGVGRVGPW